MKTSFLLSIALGIVLVVAVAIIWSVLGAAGVWDSINSIVQQAVGTDNGTPFDIEKYLGASRVLGFTMIVAVLDVILITAIATLGGLPLQPLRRPPRRHRGDPRRGQLTRFVGASGRWGSLPSRSSGRRVGAYLPGPIAQTVRALP